MKDGKENLQKILYPPFLHKIENLSILFSALSTLSIIYMEVKRNENQAARSQ